MLMAINGNRHQQHFIQTRNTNGETQQQKWQQRSMQRLLSPLLVIATEVIDCGIISFPVMMTLLNKQHYSTVYDGHGAGVLVLQCCLHEIQ
jgi:hypothetical protein